MGMRGPKRANKVGHVYGDYRVIGTFKDDYNATNRHYYLVCECTNCHNIRKIRDDNLSPNIVCKACLWERK